MAYTFEDWRTRNKHRADLTSLVTHLTRPALIDGVQLSEVQVLARIISDRRIKGSTRQSGGFIVGDSSAVCFQAAPLLGLAENIHYEERLQTLHGHRVRYTGCGLAFNKAYVFPQGGRPVIYEQTEVAKRILPPNEWWRIVDMDLTNENNYTDWTHEREWRLPGDLQFDLNYVVIIVTNSQQYRELFQYIPDADIRAVKGITVLAHAIA